MADGSGIDTITGTFASGHSLLELPLKNTAKGIYTLVVYTIDGEVITKRFVK